MSHFSVTVILPPGFEPKFEEEAEEMIAPLLAPYDENSEVDPHPETCYCVGQVAIRDARLAADHLVAPLDYLRNIFHAKLSLLTDGDEDDEDVTDALWKEHIAEHEKAEAEVLAALPWKDRPDLMCEECKGTGATITTYNPKSQWDWYVIGGRWHKAFPNKRNICKTADLGDFSPYAVVTPDGEWHQQGKMGLWGTSSDEMTKEEWKAKIRNLYQEHISSIAVLVDAHI